MTQKENGGKKCDATVEVIKLVLKPVNFNFISTEYEMKKEEEINNIRMHYEKSINTERTLKTQVEHLVKLSSNGNFAHLIWFWFVLHAANSFPWRLSFC